MIFLKKNFFSMASIGAMCIFVLGISGCASQSITDTASPNQDLKVLDLSIASISDEASAEKAINNLLDYANKKTNSGIHFSSTESTFKPFFIGDALKQKLGKAEASLHKVHFRMNEIKVSSVEDYIKMKEQESQSGLSAQDVADALNHAIAQSTLSSSSIKTAALKVANTVRPFTAEYINLMRDKAMKFLPSSGDPGSERITPIQALVIRYIVASNDDGTKRDGEVRFLAGQDQVIGFVTNITEKIGE